MDSSMILIYVQIILKFKNMVWNVLQWNPFKLDRILDIAALPSLALTLPVLIVSQKSKIIQFLSI